MNNKEYICGSLFEDDYLIRSLSNNITNQADIALTELVANAWDAGAKKVTMFIPDEQGEKLTIEDDGIGLTKKEFHERWMKLRYNRLIHQGKKVVYPDGSKSTRMAYGRNGIGRHGLLCFNDDYIVITSKDGEELSLTVSTKIKGQAIAVTEEKVTPTTKHGTKLEVIVDRNLPKAAKIREIISSRFLHEGA